MAPSGASSDESLLLGRLADEFIRAVREGGSPDVEDYAGKYPEIGVRIRELFPILLALEDAAKVQGRGGGTKTEEDPAIDPPDSPGALFPSHFVAGTILSSRYRIIGLLRRGGMGEVWRAEDLKLEQEVALKFLPEILSEDGAALARFHREVALARNVSHPNVCRVFDINEVDGRHFLSMEYIDGEDLSSLLRRIGRLPHAKGVEVALQLCKGLAAAHEKNVLHCDLKPSNVMIDGRGKARITDFGLAILGDETSRHRVRAGTLSYVAPEQIAHNEVSAKSDIYSLGLVFFEIFTGKRAYQAETLSELTLLQKRPAPRPSKIAPDIDPTIERLIMRCLQKDPDLRPSLPQILSALSGGDPIAFALAAGETPSPEMVASSPGADTMKPHVAFVYLGLFLAGLLIIILLSGVGLLHREVPFQKSPTVLADRAASIAQSFGYYDMPKDVAYGFKRDDEYLAYVMRTDASPGRWSRLYTGRPAALYFWYRQSPEYLVARSQPKIAPEDPPQVKPGMATVFLDTKGRLIGFTGIPDSSAANGKETNWQALFENAGLSMDGFKQVPPKESAVPACDVHVAWDGHFLELPDLPIHIEAASLRGSPVFFDIGGWESAALGPSIPPEGRTGFRQVAESRAFLAFGFTVFMVAIVSGALLARRNIRLGQGDRKGATRLGLYMVAVQMLTWLFQTHHVPTMAEFRVFYTGLAWAIFYAVALWVFYMGIEPYVRRRWPYRIISWSRLLSGRLHDEIVGKDILIGAALGTVCTAIASVVYLVARSAGISPDRPPMVALDTFLGAPRIVAQFLSIQKECVTDSLYVLLTVLILSGLLRKDWQAFVVAWIGFAFSAGMLLGIQHPVHWVVVGTFIAAYLAVFARFGLLATITFQFCAFMLLRFPLTANFKTWYAGTTMFVALVTTGLAGYGFFSAISGRAAFHRSGPGTDDADLLI